MPFAAGSLQAESWLKQVERPALSVVHFGEDVLTVRSWSLLIKANPNDHSSLQGFVLYMNVHNTSMNKAYGRFSSILKKGTVNEFCHYKLVAYLKFT